MFKATTTFTQARNIAMALTMSFAAATLVTACGSDDSADTTPSPEAEMSSENQNSMNMTEDNAPTASDTEKVMEDELENLFNEIDLGTELILFKAKEMTKESVRKRVKKS